MMAPRITLSRGRKRFVYVPYGNVSGGGSHYPHYKINSRLIGVHGWSYARHATKAHLAMSQGRSVLHAHTHRADASIVQSHWSLNSPIQARSVGCLCQLIPLYGTGRPVEWVHAFVLGYLGKRSDTLYTIPIMGDRCILPGGLEVKADGQTR